MVLPLIIGAAAIIAGAAGAGSGVRGGMKMKDAKETRDVARIIQNNAIELLDKKGSATNMALDSIGKQELNILSSFSDFSDVIEKIQGRPEFKEYKTDDLNIKVEKVEELREASIGAGMILGTIGGAAAGTASGVAAAGATSSAVMALGTASTGTAISGLSGVAATNATLAAIGGGSIATGGGGIALGTTLLGGATLGVGLLAGGAILGAVGSKMSKDADEMYDQAKRTEEKAQRIAETYDEIISTAKRFQKGLTDVENEYRRHFSRLENIVNFYGRTQWSEFAEVEKQVTQNTVLLVGMLYKMCQVSLVQKTEETESDEQEIKANVVEVDAAYNDSVKVLRKVRN
ncbi:hypothetical protein FC40_GL000301 [Ligilactobacillus hayakitensis DSM 18933 = JCM 14209]|uniref:Uncharacterized protein n=1 Tax=Ligilactobacillus hayakitensis DSM 18933 = JCM 14209 TaxID=1423755 RepID=A0A0R1WQN5_9LACO|nr:hypothetical protein [Ligilactobacillus hayakitensis]KRM20200.1 hypothetical protein FC40_GL000301 [Ligilactobacillus hayakitensis DSM 18933 = JCM 14209]